MRWYFVVGLFKLLGSKSFLFFSFGWKPILLGILTNISWTHTLILFRFTWHCRSLHESRAHEMMQRGLGFQEVSINIGEFQTSAQIIPDSYVAQLPFYWGRKRLLYFHTVEWRLILSYSSGKLKGSYAKFISCQVWYYNIIGINWITVYHGSVITCRYNTIFVYHSSLVPCVHASVFYWKNLHYRLCD